MLHESDKNLDALIRAEKERVAQEIFLEAWETASIEGIEANILAEQAITVLLRRLGELQGEQCVAEIVGALPDKIRNGDFLPHRVLQ